MVENVCKQTPKTFLAVLFHILLIKKVHLVHLKKFFLWPSLDFGVLNPLNRLLHSSEDK